MKRRLRVLALMHEQLVPPDSVEGLSEQEMIPFQMEHDILEVLGKLKHDVRPLGIGDELSPIRRAIDEWKPHVCFNMLTHFHDVGVYQAHIASYLELLRVAYTGCNARGLLLASDKALSKKILAYHRIRVPGFAVFRRGHKPRTPGKLTFPCIVKSLSEEASIGIAQASIVHDLEALRARVAFVHDSVGTDAIVEEYIEGRELTVGVLGNERLTVFTPRELTFTKLPKGAEPILTSRVKWDLKYQEKVGVESDFASLAPVRVAEIQQTAKRIYRALGLSGYARIDLRLRTDDRLFVIEANPNPDLRWHEDFAASAKRAGFSYSKLVQRILILALQHRPAWKTD
ncbi:MAG: ATP-grasp domain-containing protein [Planctomycetota bacterium]